MAAALSELGVTEFLVLSRVGFVPRGLVVGSCVYSAGSQYDWVVATAEIADLGAALGGARALAIARMREQAAALQADGVVGVRLEVEHHLWRGGRRVAKCMALGTAVVFDRGRAPAALRGAPRLSLASGAPFDSALSGADFVSLLHAGYSPVTVAMGNCVFGLDPRELRRHRGHNREIAAYTAAFADSRELAMERLRRDLFRQFPPGDPDCPAGIVGMRVSESVYGGQATSGPPIVEFIALGTAIKPLAPQDPRRCAAPQPVSLVVPLDR